MTRYKAIFSIVFLLILASNIWSISHWSENRRVWDDTCYLRQAHLFQRFGWGGLDTNLTPERDDDHYLAYKLREVGHPSNDLLKAPCHSVQTKTGKLVLTPPPGTGFILSLFPERFQVVPLFAVANVVVAGFAFFALWRTRQTPELIVATIFGAVAIYLMINPAKASYSMAPTLVICVFAALFTAILFKNGQRSFRQTLLLTAGTGVMLGLSTSFRLANLVLSSGYLAFFGVSFLLERSRSTFFQGLTFVLALLAGALPMLSANTINAGSPFATTYAHGDAVPPSFDAATVVEYLTDATQSGLVVASVVWMILLWRTHLPNLKSIVILVGSNVSLNLLFFLSHPVFTSYYTIPISMLSLWTLLFTALLTTPEGTGSASPSLSDLMFSRSPAKV